SSAAVLLADWAGSLGPGTRRTYTYHIRAFARWLGVPWAHLPAAYLAAGAGPATRLALRYQAALRDRGLAPSTINAALTALRSLAAFARLVGEIDWALGPVRALRVVPYRDTRGPGLEGVRALLAAAERQPDPRRALRDTLTVRLLFDLALRCQELTTVRRGPDVERDAAGHPVAIHVIAKGHHQRQRLALPPATAAALAAWLAVADPAEPRVIGLSTRGVAKRIRRLGTVAGLPAHVCHPHALRHASVSAALQTWDVRAAQRHSRHRQISTLIVYDDQRRQGGAAVADTVSRLL
ncbi:MAG: tyrosine-type recombinase/integrase, partial [Elusimicrobia bacterium]|nr:tyrosine-type recombinase/integrase [Elusimicrobiota bacterium]